MDINGISNWIWSAKVRNIIQEIIIQKKIQLPFKICQWCWIYKNIKKLKKKIKLTDKIQLNTNIYLYWMSSNKIKILMKLSKIKLIKKK